MTVRSEVNHMNVEDVHASVDKTRCVEFHHVS